MPCRSAFLGASNYGLVVMDQGGGHKGPSYTQLHLTTTAPLLGLMNNANYAALLGWVSVRARPALAGDVYRISCRRAAHAAHTAASTCAALPGLFTPAFWDRLCTAPTGQELQTRSSRVLLLRQYSPPDLAAVPCVSTCWLVG